MKTTNPFEPAREQVKRSSPRPSRSVWPLLILLSLPTLAAPQEGCPAGDWTSATACPRGALGPALCAVDGLLYSFGGATGPTAMSAYTYVYDPATGLWTRKADMPTRRAWAASSAVDGLIYVVGGTDATGAALVTVEAYDPQTDTWTSKAGLQYRRTMLATAVLDGRLYALGGGSHGLQWTPTSWVETYDPATDTWTRQANLLAPREGFVGCALRGRIYAVGSYSAFSEVYDPASDKWTRKAALRVHRTELAGCELDGQIYAIGGLDSSGQVSAVVEAYDPQTDTWIRKRHMPTARFWHAATASEGRIYVFAGGLKTTETVLRKLEVFESNADNSLRLIRLERTSPDQVLVELQGSYAGHRYRILWSSDPASGPWSTGAIRVAQSATTQVGFSLPDATPQVFIRVEETD